MSQFRFSIHNGGDIILTPWEEETVKAGGQHTAVIRVAQLRAEYPTAGFTIERRGHSTVPNKVSQVRYRVDTLDGALRYSHPLAETEKEDVLRQIKERFPGAVITEEKI